MSNTKDHDLILFKIKDNTVIADAEAVGSHFRLFQRFRILLQWIAFIPKEGLPDALFHTRAKRIDVFNGTVRLDQPVLHRPKTSVCDFTRLALKSRRATRMLWRYSGEVAVMRTSKNSRRPDFFMPFTALMIISGLTSILSAAIMPIHCHISPIWTHGTRAKCLRSYVKMCVSLRSFT